MKIQKAINFLPILFFIISVGCNDQQRNPSSETDLPTILEKNLSDSIPTLSNIKDFQYLSIDSSKLADCIKGDYNEKKLTVEEASELKSLLSFVIPGYFIMYCVKGDLNKDSYNDYILIHRMKAPNGEYHMDMESENLPVKIILGQKDNSWKEVMRNDYLLDNSSFSHYTFRNIIIDPPGTITISYAYLYGGGGFSDVEQTFMFDKKKKDWFLKSIISDRHSEGLNPSEGKAITQNLKFENLELKKKYPKDTVWKENIEKGQIMVFRHLERTQKDFGKVSISKFMFDHNWDVD